MSTENILSIVGNFTEIAVFHVDADGKIKNVVFNSKEDFKPKVKNIYDFFSREDMVRVKGLLDSGLDGTRKYLKLKDIYKVKGLIDIDIQVLEGNIYIAFTFYKSEKEHELIYERNLENLSKEAKTDPMTRLLNRYGYWERVKAMLDCGDSERRLGIILVDVDKLKQVNEIYGHSGGDKAIKQISELISGSIRGRDIAVRYGGDEFVVVVEELSGSKSSAYGLGKRLVRNINEKKGEYLTTVSVGVHVVKVGDFERYLENENKLRQEWDKAVNIADEMAYKAKEGGRNQVVFSGEEKS